MRGRAMRRLPERPMEVEPVVSYSLIPPDGAEAPSEDARVEPRLTILPLGRKPRFDEIAAPSAAEAAEHGVRFEARPIDALPPDPRHKRRRRMPLGVVVGAAALLVGFGVLAATYGRMMTSTANVTQAPAVATPAIALTPPSPPIEDTAGPGVRVIPPSGTEPAPLAGDTTTPAAATTATVEAPAIEPPQPRVRPTISQSTEPAAVAAAPPQPAPAPTVSGDDVNALMANVDKLLAEHKAAAAVAEPMPVAPALTDPGLGVPGDAAPPLLDAEGQPLLDAQGRPLRGKKVFLFPNGEGLPTPPADIPNPTN